nr:unnamed protein product [Digitaria exilis]
MSRKASPFLRSARPFVEQEACAGSSDMYPAPPSPPPRPPPSPPAGGDEPPAPQLSEDAMQLMLALFFIAAGAGAVVSRTPNSLTPPPPERAGQVRELWPLLLQREHRRVILAGGAPERVLRHVLTRADAWASYVRRAASVPNALPCALLWILLCSPFFPRR